MKEKPFKVCILSHSSSEQAFSYGYGAVRILAHAARNHPGAEYSLLDMKAGYGSAAQDAALIEQHAPDLLGLSVFMWNIQRVGAILARVRTRMPQTAVVLGGPGAVGFELLSGEPWLPDFTVEGEGEAAFLSIIQRLADRGPAWNALARTPAADRRKGSFQPEHLDQLPQDLDALKSPYLENIYSPPGDFVYLETSRGCPNACAFCMCGDRTQPLRFFGPDVIRNELQWAREHGRLKINLCDAALNYRTDHVRRVVDAAADADPGGDLGFTFALHADFLAADQIHLLSRLKIDCATMGLNSITPATFGPVKRAIDPQRFKEQARLIGELPNANITILLGLPGDTVDGFKATLDFCAALDVQINCFELRLFPGTYFFNHAAAFDIAYDPADEMKIKSCFSFTETDRDAMRGLLSDYSRSNALFVRGDDAS